MGTSPRFENPYFDFTILDDSPNLVRQSYALRYQVYCHEQNFLPAEDYPSGEETDEFDSVSAHIGVISRKGGAVIGSARIVKFSPLGLPMDSHCLYEESFFHQLGFNFPEEFLHSPSVVEISRLVVSPYYRRRANDGFYALSDGAQTRPPSVQGLERRHFNRPVFTLGILKIAYQFCKRHKIPYWVAAMEKSLIRHLAKWHMVFEPIGPEKDYYGPVRPYILAMADIDLRMSQNQPDLMEEWLDGLG